MAVVDDNLQEAEFLGLKRSERRSQDGGTRLDTALEAISPRRTNRGAERGLSYRKCIAKEYHFRGR